LAFVLDISWSNIVRIEGHIFIYLFVYLAGRMQSSLAVPELATSKFLSVVPGQETE
jgi:hypothetical protein